MLTGTLRTPVPSWLRFTLVVAVATVVPLLGQQPALVITEVDYHPVEEPAFNADGSFADAKLEDQVRLLVRKSLALADAVRRPEAAVLA